MTFFLVAALAGAQPAPERIAPPVPPEVAPSAVTASSGTGAEGPAQLARIRDLYRAADYPACSTAARELLSTQSRDSGGGAEGIDEARTYLGACLIRAGALADGDAAFAAGIRAALDAKRTFPRPNSLVFPDTVVARFDSVSRSLQREIERATQERISQAQRRELSKRRAEEQNQAQSWALYDFARRERWVVRNRRWMAWVPFGGGQFQNGRTTLGWLFFTTEALALAGTVGGLTWRMELDAQFRIAERQGTITSAELPNARARFADNLWVSSLWALGILSVGGIVQANLGFVPETVSYHLRPVPTRLRPKFARPKPEAAWAPLVSPSEKGGLMLGIAGKF